MNSWIRAFVEKYSDINVDVFDVKSAKLEDIITAMTASPFLSEKRMVCIKWVPTESKELSGEEQIIKAVETLPETTVVVFASPKPDKRKKLYTYLKWKCKIEELIVKDFRSWAKEYVARKQIMISDIALTLLCDYTEPDLYRFTNECKKLGVFAFSRQIDENDVATLCEDSSQVNLFKVMDLIATWKKKEALSELQNVIRANEDLIWVFNLVAWQVRMLIWAHELRNEETGALVQGLKVAPFVASKLRNNVRNFTLSKLLKMHRALYLIDKQLKTSQIRLDSHLALALEKGVILVD